MNLQIVSLTDYDEAGAAALVQSVGALARSSRFTASFSRMAYFLGRRQVLLVALDQEANTLVGFCQGTHLKRKGYSSVYNIGVWPGAVRQGVGRALIQAMMVQSPHRKIQLQNDERNTDGLAFYQALGFVEVGRKKSKAGDNLITLELNSAGLNQAPA